MATEYINYQLFTKVVILDQVLRHGSCSSLRLRDGNVTCDDWQTLLLRDPSKVRNSSSEFQDAVHLFYDKKGFAEHNWKLYNNQLLGSIHSSPSAAAKSDDAGGCTPLCWCKGHANRQSVAGGGSLQWCSWNGSQSTLHWRPQTTSSHHCRSFQLWQFTLGLIQSMPFRRL